MQSLKEQAVPNRNRTSQSMHFPTRHDTRNEYEEGAGTLPRRTNPARIREANNRQTFAGPFVNHRTYAYSM